MKANTVSIYKKSYTLRDLESEVTLEEDKGVSLEHKISAGVDSWKS